MNDWDQTHNRYEPGYPPGYPEDPRVPIRKKRKWLAGLLAFLVPGTGHLYLGLMAKGIAIMMLVALDICAIVFAAIQSLSALVIVLLSLLMPIIYFYNLFDALQSTDAVNDRRLYPDPNQPLFATPGSPAAHTGGPDGAPRGVSAPGVVFLAAAAVVLILVTNIGWTHWMFKSSGTMIGAIVLIGAGIGLWFWEMRGQHGPKG